MSGQRRNDRYSLAFKQKVISKIESGRLTIAVAWTLYDIRSAEPIYKWLRKFGNYYFCQLSSGGHFSHVSRLPSRFHV